MESKTAKEIPNDAYKKGDFVGLVSNLYSYIQNSKTSEKFEPIMSANFSSVMFSLKRIMFLTICYEKAFKIWDLSDPSKITLVWTQKFKKEKHEEYNTIIVSAKLYPIEPLAAFVHYKYTAITKTGIRLSAYQKDEENLFHQKFDETLLDFEVLKNRVILLFQGKISIAKKTEGMKFEILEEALAFPITAPISSVAVGKSLLAFPVENPENVSPPSSGTMYKVSIFVTSVLQNELPPKAGAMLIFDLEQYEKLFCIWAHNSEVSYSRWNPMGNLLFTSNSGGTQFHIYRISPGASTPVVHLFTLKRGIQQTVLQHVYFSSDSRWVAVTSSKQTTHIFPILPQGGIPSPSTHVPIVMPTKQFLPYPKNLLLYKEEKLNSILRLRTNDQIHAAIFLPFAFWSEKYPVKLRGLQLLENGTLELHSFSCTTVASSEGVTLGLSSVIEKKWSMIGEDQINFKFPVTVEKKYLENPSPYSQFEVQTYYPDNPVPLYENKHFGFVEWDKAEKERDERVKRLIEDNPNEVKRPSIMEDHEEELGN